METPARKYYEKSSLVLETAVTISLADRRGNQCLDTGRGRECQEGQCEGTQQGLVQYLGQQGESQLLPATRGK